MQTIIGLLVIITAILVALLSRGAGGQLASDQFETTANETWEVWIRKWIGALSPIATLVGAALAINYAALPQLELSRETSRRQLRAYVVVNGVRFFKDDGNIWRITPIVKNAGATPTKNMVYTGVAVTLRGPTGPQHNGVELPGVPQDPAGLFYSLGFTDRREIGVIGPQSDMPFPLTGQVSQSGFERMRAVGGYSEIVASGAFIYEDVFPGTKTHVTKYCVAFNPVTETQEPCGNWNCADEQCQEDARAYNKAVAISYRKAGKPLVQSDLAKVDFP